MGYDMITLQVTLFDKGGHYKPVSTLINVESIEYFKSHRKEIKIAGVVKICQKRGWTQKELEKYGYKICKIRVYDPEKIREEAKERYERIKREKGWI